MTSAPEILHEVDDGDGVCGDCLWCQENVESDCIVASDPKCAWCGHCLGNHAERIAAGLDPQTGMPA